MQLRQLVQRLQSVLSNYGNIDVVVPHPNTDQAATAGTPLFHLDVISSPVIDHLVRAGIGSINGLREYSTESAAPTVLLRISPYSIARVQGLHDVRAGVLPVTKLANDIVSPQESTESVKVSTNIQEKPINRKKKSRKKQSKKG